MQQKSAGRGGASDSFEFRVSSTYSSIESQSSFSAYQALSNSSRFKRCVQNVPRLHNASRPSSLISLEISIPLSSYPTSTPLRPPPISTPLPREPALTLPNALHLLFHPINIHFLSITRGISWLCDGKSAESQTYLLTRAGLDGTLFFFKEQFYQNSEATFAQN